MKNKGEISPVPRERKRRKEARPGELAAAALDLFVEKGYAATRLDDVAARAGVSKGTLYLYFASKEALFKAVVEDAIVPLLEAAEQKIASYDGSSVDLFYRLLMGWWEQFGATRLSGIIKLLIAEAQNFPEVIQYFHDQALERMRTLLRRIVQRGVERGEFRPQNLDLAVETIMAPLMMLVVWRYSFYLCGQQPDPILYLQTHFDLVVNGLCRREGDR